MKTIDTTGCMTTYRDKRVFVTGHTGFKGSWLCEWLLALGADVHGYALRPPTKPSLFAQLKLARRIASHTLGDVRDRTALAKAVEEVRPDFVFHLAAQPLVRLGYAQPAETFETNVMGTVNLMEAVRGTFPAGNRARRCAVVCVTTDKCYENRETTRPYREDDPMGGYDPYSCSKGCDELAIACYRRSFFNGPESPVWLASARAGNVIGGGDWAVDRIIPDCMRALDRNETITVRNQTSTRPWQHVLEPLGGYLALGAALAARRNYGLVAGGFNFGPEPAANRTVKDLVVEVLKHRKGTWRDGSDPKAVHEAGLLSLDIRKARKVLGWKPRWSFEETVEKTVAWYEAVRAGADVRRVTEEQIECYMGK